MAASLPTGTVTFLFTDIEGSTKVAQEQRDTWETLRTHHHALMRSAIETHLGHVFQVVGDGFCAAFHTVREALNAAVQAQRDLQAESGGETPIRVRMGIHTGEAQELDGDYRGYLTLTRAQRVMSAGHGGQILLSNSSAELVRRTLLGELGLRDLGEHRLKSLPGSERIWQVVSPGLRQDFPALESLRSVPNNLPVELTSFVGREAEIAGVRELLQTHRLVTLTGAGGTGKTRLSLEVAAELLDRFRDGVWFIELAPLSDPTLVPNTVGSALGVREEQGRPLLTTLLNWMGDKELLLILDNCEHLIEACATFADEVLHGGRGSRILATSREGLGIAGEHAFLVPTLEAPQSGQASRIPLQELIGYPAVRLFTDRARESVGTFNVTPANAAAVAQICYRLDGIPLAIELAAARVKVLDVGQIAQRLDDRFRLLTGGRRTALPRHQTLRSLIDWSHSLLSEPERVLLRRSSVFAGGWTLEAAEHVCAAAGIESHQILDLLAHLVDKSLVIIEAGTSESRYAMLETIREYAREKLSESGEVQETHDRHLEFMQDLAERAGAELERQDEILWLRRLDPELDNLRLALEWALGRGDPEAALRVIGEAQWFWWNRAHGYEAMGRLRTALGRAGAENPTKARAKALTTLGWFLCFSGELAAGLGYLADSVAAGRAIREKQTLAESLTWFGFMNSMFGDPASGAGMLEEGLALARELGYKPGAGRALVGVGQVKLAQGNYQEAQASFEESAALLGETGDRNTLAFALRRLGHLALRQADHQKAFALCSESLRLNYEVGDKQGVANCLAAIASIAGKLQRPLRAVQLRGATAAVLESFNGQLIPLDQIENEPYLKETRAELDEQAYDQAYAEGHAMNTEQAVAYALEHPGS